MGGAGQTAVARGMDDLRGDAGKWRLASDRKVRAPQPDPLPGASTNDPAHPHGAFSTCNERTPSRNTPRGFPTPHTPDLSFPAPPRPLAATGRAPGALGVGPSKISLYIQRI